MIQQIHDLPTNMVGFHSSGEVTKDDFDIVQQKVAELVEETDKLNYLLYLENSPADFTLGAWAQDALLGIKNLTKWNRAAIISDSDMVDNFTKVFSVLMPGEFKVFPKADYQTAINWTSEKVNIE
ncbi:STAS/SEC14 domain-containing protein [Flavobacterium sp. PLA-1-15]|uniref:STAS/SEC14 domain-containing protein n=1 Tax=Flavobacterium sp. PLA-1-15 TaxID=3380533 RepID=UPI003B804DB5